MPTELLTLSAHTPPYRRAPCSCVHALRKAIGRGKSSANRATRRHIQLCTHFVLRLFCIWQNPTASSFVTIKYLIYLLNIKVLLLVKWDRQLVPAFIHWVSIRFLKLLRSVMMLAHKDAIVAVRHCRSDVQLLIISAALLKMGTLPLYLIAYQKKLPCTKDRRL